MKDESTGGYWESLLQKMDVLDKQPPSRQITDNRKFEYHFEINAAPGQDEKAIADEVTTVTKTILPLMVITAFWMGDLSGE